MESLNKHFAAITRPAFQRHGFASEQLVAQWRVIVGDEVAAISRPEKIKWPRGNDASGHQSGGTLVLKAIAGRTLELHYETPRIIEKVNQFLGYGAIAALKVTPDNAPPPPTKIPRKPMKPEAAKAWAENFDDIEDSDLKAALSKLASFSAPNGPKIAFSTGVNRVLSPSPNSSRKTP